ncbi:MAG TPA: excinuclease ABC subunit UvrC [Candidatus Saccharimonadales bacterium]|nr:excinuclease ABC subunit UvrC [Candidatus Saccharimonadales bacterium]
MNKKLEDKLKMLPRSAGVYFHKSKKGEIIYVGKAAVLKNRVRQYFQSTRDMDVKTRALVAEIDDTDWVETESEIDALFLESEMVKRYMPRYNILLRDDKSQTFIRIDMKSDWPYVCFTRNPADDNALYFGPYHNGFAVKKALRYLRKVFPYYTKPPTGGRPDLDTHIGLSPKPETTSEEYKATLRKLIRYLEGGRKALAREIEKDMKLAAKLHDFETAASLRNKLNDLRELQRRIMFGDKEFLDISKDKALSDLRDLLNLKKQPVRIEGYDISHMSGTNVVASMVVFSNGVSDRSNYRKFKTRIEHNNDFYNMHETLTRRLSEKNIKAWGCPDLVLIDGGKGQLDAALQARDERGQTKIPFIGLAKREEQIVIKHEVRRVATRGAAPTESNNVSEVGADASTGPAHTQKGTSASGVTLDKAKLQKLDGYTTITEDFTLINLPHNSHIIKLLQRIRDESHRFAVSYHTVLKRQKQTASSLENIPGIGPSTRKKLIKTFGSLRGVQSASVDQLVAAVGPTKAASLARYLSVS